MQSGTGTMDIFQLSHNHTQSGTGYGNFIVPQAITPAKPPMPSLRLGGAVAMRPG